MPTRRIVLWSLLGLLLATGTGAGSTEPWALAQEEHPWGRFAPGAWKVVRVETVRYDAEGSPIDRVESTTETFLESVTADGGVLRVTVTNVRDGQRYSSPPTRLELAFRTSDPAEQHVGNQTLEIAEKTVQTGVYAFASTGSQIQGTEPRLSSTGPQTLTHSKARSPRETTTVYYNPDQLPYVMRQESAVHREGDDAAQVSFSARVTRLDEPIRVLDDRQSGWEVVSVRKTPLSTVQTTELHSPDVPGSLVSSVSVETDLSGRVTRRSTVELVQYGTCTQFSSPRTRAQLRRQLRRASRK